MTWFKHNWFKLTLGLAGIIVSVALYQNSVVIPREEIYRKQSLDSIREAELEVCLDMANTEYYKLQKLNGTKKIVAGEEVYTVPIDTREWIQQRVQEMKDECYRRIQYSF